MKIKWKFLLLNEPRIKHRVVFIILILMCIYIIGVANGPSSVNIYTIQNYYNLIFFYI